MKDVRPIRIRLLDASGLLGCFALASACVAWAPNHEAAIACGLAALVSVGLTLERMSIYRDRHAIASRHLAEAETERDSYSDALASVIEQAGRGDLDGVRAHANQALETGDYHGRLRAAQDALEAAAVEEADLLARSCADEMRAS